MRKHSESFLKEGRMEFNKSGLVGKLFKDPVTGELPEDTCEAVEILFLKILVVIAAVFLLFVLFTMVFLAVTDIYFALTLVVFAVLMTSAIVASKMFEVVKFNVFVESVKSRTCFKIKWREK